MNPITFNNTHIHPSKIVCIGRNYVEHAKELGNDVPTDPVIFIKPNSAISETLCSGVDEPIHYETELCFLIKDSAIAGVGLGLDLTKRALQSRLKEKGLPWERAKSFDGAALFTDFISPPDNLDALRFTLEVEGELRQEGDISLMLFKPQSILEECLSFLSFEDGDIVMTGTPKGVGEVEKGNKFKVVLYQKDNVLLQHEWSVEGG